MKSELYFELKMKYTVTMYKPLKELVVHEFWDEKQKKYIWLFRVSDLEKVLTIVCTEIEINKSELIPLLERCPYVKEKFQTEKYKGKGFLKVSSFPLLFIIETVIGKKPVTKRIPRETVNTLWKVIKKQPLLKPIKTRTVAENFCKEIGITRFNRGKTIYEEKDIRIQSTKEGSFDFAKIFGEREDYFKFYYSLKVLQHYGIIEHHKWGAVERLSDKWEEQEKIVEPTVIG